MLRATLRAHGDVELYFEGTWRRESSGRERKTQLSTSLRAHGDVEGDFKGAW